MSVPSATAGTDNTPVKPKIPKARVVSVVGLENPNVHIVVPAESPTIVQLKITGEITVAEPNIPGNVIMNKTIICTTASIPP